MYPYTNRSTHKYTDTHAHKYTHTPTHTHTHTHPKFLSSRFPVQWGISGSYDVYKSLRLQQAVLSWPVLISTSPWSYMESYSASLCWHCFPDYIVGLAFFQARFPLSLVQKGVVQKSHCRLFHYSPSDWYWGCFNITWTIMLWKVPENWPWVTVFLWCFQGLLWRKQGSFSEGPMMSQHEAYWRLFFKSSLWGIWCCVV